MFQDPICGRQVDEKRAVKVVYEGKAVYFCSKECAEQFSQDPEGFLEEEGED